MMIIKYSKNMLVFIKEKLSRNLKGKMLGSIQREYCQQILEKIMISYCILGTL